MIVEKLEELCLSDYVKKGRVLCFDYGDKRIGVAISDINWMIASPFKIFPSHGIFNHIFEVFTEYAIKLIVVGMPKTLKGEKGGAQLEKIQKFVAKLNDLITEKGLDIKIIYWDERFSSVAANRYLEEAEMNLSKRKQNLDKVAASFILDGFLRYAEFSNTPPVAY